MNIVILCGGSGTRLWPISRTLFPKQFVKLFNNSSLFQHTIQRNSFFDNASFSIIINQEQYFLGLDQWEEVKVKKDAHFILEPTGRNTAPAIALAALSRDPEEILLVVPSDHTIANQRAYEEVVSKAVELAKDNKLVTFGIKPSYPETGYGYIEANGFDVTSFKEKPDEKTAQEYVKAGNYFWNSGMFCFKAKTYLEELKKHSPDIYEASLACFNNARRDGVTRLNMEDMKAIRSESIDYAVMEKSQNVKVVPSDIGWSDLGSFDSLYEALPKDSNGNTKASSTIHLGSKNNLVISHKRLISTIDIEDLMIVDTQDALVIAKKGSTQKVKDLVAEVKKHNHEMTNVHTTAHRPWGTYTVLDDTPGYKVKQITVYPGAKLSLQYHHHRSEHWIVVKGIATVTVGDKTFDLNTNESTYIPKEAKHRLENCQDSELVIIEAQVGNYLGEDDIVRLQDDYKRN
ncbi:MAG: mannose-1-phosphate guanylyltransferase/mannose-6-phosphate isomerase [Candidatus Caldatribacteriota bacterium]